MTVEIILLIVFVVKHFIFDFVYQPPYQWQNKGTYGHPGGILHAGQHALSSAVILAPVSIIALEVLILAVVFEFIVHYHMDWFKMKYNAHKGWGATTHNEFWILLGFDQLVHMLTYIVMAIILI